MKWRFFTIIKMIFCFLLLILSFFSLIYFCLNIQYRNNTLYWNAPFQIVVFFPLLICPLCITFCILSCIENYKFFHFNHRVRYTYEEYKEKRDKQKSEKQAEDKQKKIENLKQQLSDLENTD